MKELLELIDQKLEEMWNETEKCCHKIEIETVSPLGLKKNLFSALYKSIYYMSDTLYLLKEAQNIIDDVDGRVITEENFFENTEANFVFMKELSNEDELEWSYISHKPIFNMWGDFERKSDEVSSMYKYGEDEGGRYVLRTSAHWSGRMDCNDVGTCRWTLVSDDKEKSIEIDKMLLNEKFLIGKSYLKDFKNYIKVYPYNYHN